MDPDELSARRIADRGREALLARLRIAFTETAAAHSQLVQVDGDRMEQLVQDAADRASGALWRRALAEVAMSELELPLAAALDHPDVRRAQEMLGVPAYEPQLGLGAEGAYPAPPAAPPQAAPAPTEPALAPPEPEPAEPEPAEPEPAELEPAEPEPAEPEPAEPEPLPGELTSPPGEAEKGYPEPEPAYPELDPTELEPAHPELEPELDPEPPGFDPALPELPDLDPDLPDLEPAVPDAIRIGAIHLEGIETLRQGARNIELRFSDIGLDVIGTTDGEAIGRLTWAEIVALELPRRRRSLRRRRGSGPELVVSTDRGQARFELREVTDEEAREHLAPVLQLPQHPGA